MHGRCIRRPFLVSSLERRPCQSAAPSLATWQLGNLATLYLMDSPTRETLQRLGAAYALAWATTSMAVGAGSAAIVNMTGNLSYAGVYVALFNISAAAGAALGGRAMDRLGRKPPLI